MEFGNLFNYLFRFIAIPQLFERNTNKFIEQQTKGAQTLATSLKESFCEALSLLAIWCSEEPKQTLEKAIKGQLARDVIDYFGSDICASLKDLIHDLSGDNQENCKTFFDWSEKERQKIQNEVQNEDGIKEKLCEEIKILLSKREFLFSELNFVTDCQLYPVFKSYLPIGKAQELELSQKIAKNSYEILEKYCDEYYLPALFSCNPFIVRVMKEIFYYKIKFQQDLFNIIACLRQEKSLHVQEELVESVNELIKLFLNKKGSQEQFSQILQEIQKKENKTEEKNEASLLIEELIREPKQNIPDEEKEELQQTASFSDILENAELVRNSILGNTEKNLSSDILPIVQFCNPLFQVQNVFKLSELETGVKQCFQYATSLQKHICWKRSDLKSLKETSHISQQTASMLYSVGNLEYIQRAVDFYHQTLNLALDPNQCGVIHFNLFMCYLQLESFDLALSHLCRACTYDAERFAPVDFKKFRLLKILGYGCTGVVFKVMPKLLDKTSNLVIQPYALKTIWYGWGDDNSSDQQFFRDSLQQEIACLKKLTANGTKEESSKIIGYVEDGEYKNRPYLLMEYFEGKSLADLVDNIWQGTPVFRNCIPIVYQLAQALSEVHECGLSHLDIKPHNILFNEKTKEIRLIDFGIARRIPSNRETSVGANLTSLSLTMAYSQEFASPEQKSQLRIKPGVSSDIYSFGKTACYLLVHNTDAGELHNLKREEPEYAELIQKFSELIYGCVIRNATSEVKVTLSETKTTSKGFRQSIRLNDLQEILSTIQQVGLHTFGIFIKSNPGQIEIEETLKAYQNTNFFPELVRKMASMELNWKERIDIFSRFLLSNPQKEAFRCILDILKTAEGDIYPELRFEFIQEYLRRYPKNDWTKELLQLLQKLSLGDKLKYQFINQILFSGVCERKALRKALELLETLKISFQERYGIMFNLLEQYPNSEIVLEILEKVSTELIESLLTEKGKLSKEGILLLLLKEANKQKQNNATLKDELESKIFTKLEPQWQSQIDTWLDLTKM